LVGCSGGNPLHEVAQGISAATITARSVSLAMVAVGGTPLSCTSIQTGCVAFPCSASVTVDVGNCPMPLAAADSGTITVSGTWSSATAAMVSVTLVDVKVAATNDVAALENVTQVSANFGGGDAANVTYTSANAGARSGISQAAVGGSQSWSVDIMGLTTPDPADDVFQLRSSSASVSAGLGANVDSEQLDSVEINGSCALNPINGTGSITKVQTIVPSVENISFHSACDGKGTINGTNYDFDITS
jgi:hypothetical protein